MLLTIHLSFAGSQTDEACPNTHWLAMDKLLNYHMETNNHSMDNLELPVNLTCMALDYSMKQRSLEETYTPTARTCKLKVVEIHFEIS